MVILDTMAQRYGRLPSEIIKEATTFDLAIMDMALGYERYLREKDKPGHVPDVSVDTLLAIRERAL